MIEGSAFTLQRHRSRHYLRAFGGWGVNASVWETVKRNEDVLYIIVEEPDTGRTFTARKLDLMNLEESGEVRTIAYSDEQVVLKEAFFEQTGNPQGRLF